MTHESFPPPPDDEPVEPYIVDIDGLLAEYDVSEPRTEFGESGSIGLAHSVAQIAETGGLDSVDAYLADLLDDTENRSPDERFVAFSVLSDAQRSKIRNEVSNSGDAMVQAFETNAATAYPIINRAAEVTSRAARVLPGAFDEIVGSAVRAGKPNRVVVEANEQFGAKASNAVKSATPVIHAFGTFSAAQSVHATQYKTVANKASADEQALSEAEEFVVPGYEGEPKAVSQIIDADVRRRVADMLVVAVSQAAENGTSPEAAIQHTLNNPDVTGRKASAYLTVATSYIEALQAEITAIKTQQLTAGNKVSSIITKAADGYTYSSRSAHTAEIYSRQKADVNGLPKDIEDISKIATTGLDAASEKLTEAKQLVARSDEE